MKTKLLYLLFIAAPCFVSKTQAQTFTAKAGLNLANVKENGGGLNLDYDMKPGLHLGLAAELPINNWLAIEPALLFNQKGAKFNNNLFGTKS
jgi:hypothetical protein